MGRRAGFALVGLLMGVAPVSAVGEAAPDAVTRGEAIYLRCIACHSLDRNRTGPLHCDLLGRAAATVPGFSYSPALRESRIVWTKEALDEFLADPLGAVPGTRMGYAGVTDATERADLIEYLAWASASAPQCLRRTKDERTQP